MMSQHQKRVSARSGALSLLCMLLILFAAFAQINHVHTGKSNSPNHECSVCSVAHSTALARATYQPVPVFVRSSLNPGRKISSKSFLLISSLYIRPPPSV
jgi:hypothetical protein